MDETNQAARDAAWLHDRLDPDNWLTIPDFGVQPADVDYVGFADPIVTPHGDWYKARRECRLMVKRARDMAFKHFDTVADINEASAAATKIVAASKSLTQGLDHRQLCALLVTVVQESLRIALGGDSIEARAYNLASAGGTVALLVEFDLRLSAAGADAAVKDLMVRLTHGAAAHEKRRASPHNPGDQCDECEGYCQQQVSLTLQLPHEFVERCAADKVEPAAVLRGFIADLCEIQSWASNARADGYSSNGSDERRLANEYYERVGWPWINKPDAR